MLKQELINQIRNKKSFLCIGLDTDIDKLPEGIDKTAEGVFQFNKQIIDATHDLCVAYKPNTAFYESAGSSGWLALEKTINYINEKHPAIFTIADAKRGDIGNTSKLYAKTFFEQMNFDAVTVAPYMGSDSVLPFFDYKNKWVILLALTSNKGAEDFQLGQKNIFTDVLTVSQKWANTENMMYVVGATRPQMLADVRKIVPHHFLLVPGIGAQGGSLSEIVKYGMTKDCGLLVNASRSIIYASTGKNFAQKARGEALNIQQEMKQLL